MKITASYKKVGKWYAGWIDEIPGVNTQGRTLVSCKKNLREALKLVIETNKMLTEKNFGKQAKQTSSVPRHNEINKFTAENILKDIGIWDRLNKQ